MQLGPPYHVLIDTNFINFSIQYKLDIFSSMMDCLLAKAIPCVTDCVVAELEKMGQRYRLALKLTKDPRFKRLSCQHKGTYADDCLVDKVKAERCFMVATNDKDLKRRLRKVPGVPIMYVKGHKYAVEKFSDDLGNF
uniref:PIN domain-containing protein n=1 Tax=Strombidium rassoulzadegani TaxID=1082188 RepID=A0A7S3CN38_9SPIT|mmetsp:Transcript_17991/g.30630  ORF Transcript_17991/g.30630 Transcript_17991/m.30630 type:complete len:137 (+) Transcript_17991:223-633(+)